MRLCTLFVLLLMFYTQASASLLVSPSRVAFDVRDRTAEVLLLNTSDEVKSFKLEWTNQKQSDMGEYIPLEGIDAEKFPRADQFIRFSPRRITLQPGESQKVKLMARRKPNMNQDEYRSHLRFTALPRALSHASNNDEAAEGVSIRLNLLLSYSIPVILRTANPIKGVKITDLRIESTQNQGTNVVFNMKKPSSTSVYGDFTVYHEINGEVTEVGYLNGVNMFAENKSLRSSINLLEPVEHLGGTLRVRYKGRAEFADTILDETSMQLR